MTMDGKNPNDYQVAGNHYAASIQHWDFAAANFGPGYFTGQITKYVARARQKNGLQDLEKARHFLVKYLSIDWLGLGWIVQCRMSVSPAAFCFANGLTEQEARVIAFVNAGMTGAEKALPELDRLIAAYTGIPPADTRPPCGDPSCCFCYPAEQAGGEPGPGYVDQDRHSSPETKCPACLCVWDDCICP